jgi:signal peptidase II
MVWVLIVFAGFILDRLSKMWVLDSLVGNPVTVINNFFYLSHLENGGASFGILQGKTLLLIIMTSLVALALIYYLIKNKNRYLRVTISLILAGAFGNLFDRIFRGSVIDFLEFHFGSYVFPTFNVADTLVVIGTVLLAIYVLFIYKEDKPVEVPVVEEDTK